MEQDIVRKRGRRVMPLFCQGWAALVVVFGHCLNAFQPNIVFAGKFYYVMVRQAKAAVIFFFFYTLWLCSHNSLFCKRCRKLYR